MSATAPICPVHLVSEAGWPALRGQLPAAAMAYAEATGFTPASGKLLALPALDGGIEAVLLGIGSDEGLKTNPFLLGKLATDAPAGRYAITGELCDASLAYLGFLMGQYRFDRFKTVVRPAVELAPPAGCDVAQAQIMAEAMAMGRDLINRPANDLTTLDLAEAARNLGKRFGARINEIIGDDLLAQNFPLIHAVGRASTVPPRLVELNWGDPTHPKVTLVGKGVVFDTGGLNIKPDNSMLLMKKDMGGAAAALTAAQIIMASGSKLRLRVLLPIVENAIAGNAFRPGDIYRSRKGITVEIGNTDAEGRLVLADALAFADEDAPDLLVDFATLTGAARVALGPDLPPFFSDSETLCEKIETAARAMHDPVWRLPLWKPYLSMMESKSADINNAGAGGFAGSITAALFLKQFVTKTAEYVHFDIYGWNPAAKPGRPEGGDVQAARLVSLLAHKM